MPEIITEQTDGWETTVETARQSFSQCRSVFLADCFLTINSIRDKLDRLEDTLYAYSRATQWRS